MADLPSCECIYGLPLNDKLDAIYCYLYQHATSTVSLPSCDCVKGYTLMDKVSAIYCALLQLSTGGGSVTLADITDMSAFWKNANAQTPAASTYLTSDGAGVFAAVLFSNISITKSQISDATTLGKDILGLSTIMPNYTIGGLSGVTSVLSGASTANVILEGGSPFTGSVSPVTSIDALNGVATNIS